MDDTGSHSTGADDELDDPGRDPKGLDPPRNPLSGGVSRSSVGADQDSGQGDPADTPGTEGPSDVPEAPTDDDARA